MDSPEKIAVCCYYFPPMNTVGGRRWIKFARYLSQQGIKTVFFTGDASDFPADAINQGWENELKFVYKVIPVKSGYPAVVNNGVRNFWQKFTYRWHCFLLRRKTNGNIYDPSQLWKDKFRTDIFPVLQKEGIKKVVVSGAPFAYMYYALELKKLDPSIRLYADFRDLWTDSTLGYGDYIEKFQGKERYEEECRRQKEVLDKYDFIWAVSDDIADIFISRHGISPSKIRVLTNGFDPADGMSEKTHFSLKSDKIRFLYIGTINCGREYYLRFLNALKKLSREHPEVYGKLEFTFVGNNNGGFSRDLKELQLANIIQLPRKSLQELLVLSEQMQFLLYFKLESDLENSFGTKFFDYLRFRLPIVLLSPEGAVTHYIREHKSGFVLNDQDVYASMAALIGICSDGQPDFDLNHRHEQFNLEFISKKLIECLSQP